MSDNGRDNASRYSSLWLDVDDEERSANKSQSPPEALDERTNSLGEGDSARGPMLPSQLPDDQRSRIADLQLVDALLSGLSPSARERREVRIERVMAAVHADLPSPPPVGRPVSWKPAIAIAVALLVALGLFWDRASRASRASVILREIGETTLEKVDRVYTLLRDGSASDTGSQVEGKLYLRGRDGFVLVCGDVVLGRSGGQYWLVPKQGPVVLSDSFQWMVSDSERRAGELALLKQLAVDSRRMSIMQLSAVVQLMRHDYELEVYRQQHAGRAIDAIVGTLRRDRRHLPDTISLWADADTRIIERAQFAWGPGNTLTLQLTHAERLPGNWYEHAAHHDGQRGVRHVRRERGQ